MNDLQLGRNELAVIPGGEGDGSVQVATAVNAESGEVVVLLRTGEIVSVLSPESATALGHALISEAILALHGGGKQ